MNNSSVFICIDSHLHTKRQEQTFRLIARLVYFSASFCYTQNSSPKRTATFSLDMLFEQPNPNRLENYTEASYTWSDDRGTLIKLPSDHKERSVAQLILFQFIYEGFCLFRDKEFYSSIISYVREGWITQSAPRNVILAVGMHLFPLVIAS